MEFTLTTPGCLDRVAEFKAKHGASLLIGCGTIMNVADAEKALDAGAEFIVMPVMLPEVIRYCAANNVVCIPGCATPTELFQAHQHGAPIQKLFPGVAGGHNWVKATAAALPMLRLNPTSGVDLDNAHLFLANGATSVGLVAPLFNPDLMKANDWAQIEANARKVCANVATVGPAKI